MEIVSLERWCVTTKIGRTVRNSVKLETTLIIKNHQLTPWSSDVDSRIASQEILRLL
jgi:hypothetical protein